MLRECGHQPESIFCKGRSVGPFQMDIELESQKNHSRSARIIQTMRIDAHVGFQIVTLLVGGLEHVLFFHILFFHIGNDNPN